MFNFERLRRLRLFLDCPTGLPARGLFDSKQSSSTRFEPFAASGFKIGQSQSSVSFMIWMNGSPAGRCRLANRGARHRLVKADFFSPISITSFVKVADMGKKMGAELGQKFSHFRQMLVIEVKRICICKLRRCQSCSPLPCRPRSNRIMHSRISFLCSSAWSISGRMASVKPVG